MKAVGLKCAADVGFVLSIASSEDIVVRRKVKVEVLRVAVLRNFNLKFSRYEFVQLTMIITIVSITLITTQNDSR